MDRRMKRRAKTAIAAALAAALALASAAAAEPYRRGEYITVRGLVTDLDGNPLPGVTVLFEPSRRVFKLFRSKRNRPQTDRLQIPTVTGAGGDYSFEWRWDGYYDIFELAIAVPVEAGGGEAFEILHRTDFTDRMTQGSPVEVALEVEDASRLTAPRRRPPSVAGGDQRSPAADLPRPSARAAEPVEASSEDQRRILDEMGSPDRIDSHQRLAGTETSWWYFEEGKVYHFLGGGLSQVTHFDPIPPEE